MSDYDNSGQVSLWKNDGDNPKAPILKGSVIAHRDIKRGEAVDVALWKNDSDNPRAPTLKGKISDKRQPHEQAAQTNADTGFDDDLPFN